MHVDGFRFDLASVLAPRRGRRAPVPCAAPLGHRADRPSLARTQIIAEAWDAGGLYQVGDFPGFRWAEWNGRYRDCVRALRPRRRRPDRRRWPPASPAAATSTSRSDACRATASTSSPATTASPSHDLVSYNEKHNEANGEDNRDGSDDNLSWNCGVEGPTDDPRVLALRRRQATNFVAILLLSQGVPMLLAGDEFLRTQRGNNNAYCQDNELVLVRLGRLVKPTGDARLRAV